MIDPNRIRLIDVEASGLGPESYPIEIGYSVAEGQYASLLINPDTALEWGTWDPVAEAMHGIARADAVQYGEDVMIVARRLNEWLGTATWYTDGYREDLGWITRLYEEVSFEPSFRLASLQGLLKNCDEDLAGRYDEIVMLDEPTHRAEGDLKQIREVLRRLPGGGDA